MTYTHKMVNGERVDLTPQEIAEFEARDKAWEAEHNEWLAKEAYKDQRKIKYIENGCTDSDMIHALWDYVFDKKEDVALALKAIRDKINQDIPEPSKD
jgi:hypothetical protein